MSTSASEKRPASVTSDSPETPTPRDPPGASSPDELTVRPIAPTERQDEVAALLQAVMKESTHWDGSELWQWKHVDNPFGQSLVLVSEAPAGRLAGLRAFMRWRFQSSNGPLEAFRPVDTATHPDFRRRGIFTKLTLEALEQSRQSGGAIIFNTPNSMSVSGYMKMGWTQVGVATPALKVRNFPVTALKLAGRVARKKLGLPVGSQPVAEPVPEALSAKNAIRSDFDGLIARHNENERQLIGTDRSMAFLKWRYADNPLYDYAVIADRQAGELNYACIVRMAPGGRLNTLIFEDFLLSEPDHAYVERLVSMAFDAFRPDAGSAYAPPGTPMSRVLSKVGFGRQSRSRINFVCNPLVSELAPAPSEFSNWAIGMSELEIF